MQSPAALLAALRQIPGLTAAEQVPLKEYTRFAIGGPARLFAETSGEEAFVAAVTVARQSEEPFLVIGGGTNLIVADGGYDGLVLRFAGNRIRPDGSRIHVQSGAVLQDLVDTSIAAGLAGLHTMTGIPGWVGAAIYGNAGAYGRNVSQSLESVRFFDGAGLRTFSNADCQFHYRESIFKQSKEWLILDATFALTPADASVLRAEADKILATRNAKYPPSMKCAGSIFKNLLLDELPEPVRRDVPAGKIIEGKVPSAWFLEAVGAKGMAVGDIKVADYHANLIYNEGSGTAAQVRQVIGELKDRVRERFGFDLEEEVQYVGFAPSAPAVVPA